MQKLLSVCIAGVAATLSISIHSALADSIPPAYSEVHLPFPDIDIGQRQSSGQDAVNRLGFHLGDVANWYGKSSEELRQELLKDHMIRIDRTGRLFAVEELGAAYHAELLPFDQQSSINSGALVDLGSTFKLHSHPGVTRTIYLDFNGAKIANTAWNSNGTTINAVPYDIDGDRATFSAGEQQRIQYIWQRVAEDYAPFDVDVTTEQPTADILTRSDGNDQIFGTTVVITSHTGVYSCSCGGIAYIGIFNETGGSTPPDYYKPAFVFYDMLGSGDEKAVAEAISHEAGHNMGLHHDGTASVAYYAGQGSDAKTGWAPIMGVGYSKPLVQFSKGEYSGANNTEDDYAVAQSFGLPRRLDDYGSTIAAATPLTYQASGTTATGTIDGVIETPTDRDVFAISAGPGVITASAIPASRSPDLDVVLTLMDSGGNVLASNNPLNALNASLTYSATKQGNYFLEVKGAGQGDPLTTGYSTYGSRGNYRLSASYTMPVGTPPAAVLKVSPTSGPAPLAVKLDGTASTDDGKVTFWYWDFGDGNGDKTGTLASTTHVYQVAGNYLAKLDVVDNNGLSASTTQTISVTAPQASTNVQSIKLSLKSDSLGNVWTAAVATVVNQLGKAVPNANVTGQWSGIVSKSSTGTTNSSGTVTFTSPKTRANGCFTITITGVTVAGYKFNPSAGTRTAQLCR